MYILGINLSHHGSACLLKDGRILYAIAEERLDGIKYSALRSDAERTGQSKRMPPMRSISYCLRSADIGIDELELIIANNADEPVNINSLKSILPVKDKAKIKSLPHPSHHLAHAYSSYFCSPFAESAVLVADGFGSNTSKGTEAESGFYAKNKVIEPILKTYQVLPSRRNPNVKVRYSLTYIYNFISLALGFSTDNNDKRLSPGAIVSEAGKTMGLAAYGKEVRRWPPIVELSNESIETGRFTRWALDNKIGRMIRGSLAVIVKEKDKRLTQFHKNLAYKAQSWCKNRKIPAENNRVERELRPTVIARKVSFGSQSDEGAKTREILMTVLHTLKKRGADFGIHFKSALDSLAVNSAGDPYQLLYPPDT